jgi:hypothetical protein
MSTPVDADVTLNLLAGEMGATAPREIAAA